MFERHDVTFLSFHNNFDIFTVIEFFFIGIKFGVHAIHRIVSIYYNSLTSRNKLNIKKGSVGIIIIIIKTQVRHMYITINVQKIGITQALEIAIDWYEVIGSVFCEGLSIPCQPQFWKK